MPFSDLPYEILEAIVASSLYSIGKPAPAEPPFLKTLSLVNTSFRRICQGYLWSELFIVLKRHSTFSATNRHSSLRESCRNNPYCSGPRDPARHRFRSAELLEVAAHLLDHVKLLNLHFDLHTAQRASQHAGIQLLNRCRNIEIVTIHWEPIVPSPESISSLQDAFSGRTFEEVWLRPASHETMKVLSGLARDPQTLGFYLPESRHLGGTLVQESSLEHCVRPAKVAIRFNGSGWTPGSLNVLHSIQPPPYLEIATSWLSTSMRSMIGDWAGTVAETLAIGTTEYPVGRYGLPRGSSDILPCFTRIRHLHLASAIDTIQALLDTLDCLHIHKWPIQKWPAGSADLPFLDVLHAHVKGRTPNRCLKIAIYDSVLTSIDLQSSISWNEADRLVAHELDMGQDGRCHTGGKLWWCLQKLWETLDGERSSNGI